MQRDIVVRGRSLGGSSDLTLLAPIRPGFVESLESVTYKTRIKRVLEALHGARTTAHEYATARLLSDSVERVGAIHSVRVAVLEPEDKVLLAVTFDGSWESYIRVLWDKVGTLLDLIFCGTVDYVTAYDHTFEEWLVWARRVQVETGFFYGPADSTARDVLYHRRIERMRVRGMGAGTVDAELNEIRAVLPSAEDAVQRAVTGSDPLPDDPPVSYPGDVRMVRERIRNGLQGLAGLYRLTDLHRPGTPDGTVLRNAALQLLLEFVQMHDDKLIRKQLRDVRDRFAHQLDWLFPNGDDPVALSRKVPLEASKRGAISEAIRADVQGGILRSYQKTSHGVLLFLSMKDAKTALQFLDAINGRITSDGAADQAAAVYRNVVFTCAGLRAAGLSEDDIELFPEEFRQGMAMRAGVLGDLHDNHPRRWRLPLRFTGVTSPPGVEPVELESVHAILQLRCDAVTPAQMKTVELHDTGHPLQAEVNWLVNEVPDLHVLAAQSLRRNYRTQDGVPVIIEHFGFADGNGQPEVEPGPVRYDRNRINLGEIVHGHDNAVDFGVDPGDPSVPEYLRARLWWLANGSFLAMRKYRQFVSRMEKAVAATTAEMEKTLGGKAADYIDVVYAKLMGRDRFGTPIVAQDQTDPARQNVFDYEGDKQGSLCPLHAHVRRAHPRPNPAEGGRIPRLMRRSMSYGPSRDSDKPGAEADRGLVFMAYNADLGQQYEVVQRWLTEGNSTGASSHESCPIVGVPENGMTRHFRFEHPDANGRAHVFRVALEENPELLEEQPAITRLEWGLYLFVPSMMALGRMRAAAKAATAAAPSAGVPWRVGRGRELIASMQQLRADQGAATAASAWKQAIEDPNAIDSLDSAAVWAAIRADHDGILQTPYGTLVASRELITQVLMDPGGHYSISGQLERMKVSIGEIFLGLDAGARYDEEALPINSAIGDLTRTEQDKEAVFKIAIDAANRKIDAIIDQAKSQAVDATDERYDVGFDAREVVDEVLADLCEAWFGIQGSAHFQRGGSDWNWDETKPPIYPGHFTALSRFMFQPNPGALPAELAIRYGQSLRKAMKLFVEEHLKAKEIPQSHGADAPIAKAIFTHAGHATDADWIARTMVGVLMGFIAPIIGAVLNVVREWQRDGRFGALRAELQGSNSYSQALAIVAKPMASAARMRPMPQIVWRTATKPHKLGLPGKMGVEIEEGEVVVLGLVSGTQQSLGDGRDDGHLMFGGNRSEVVHPTHACPGYLAGVAAMLGALTALLGRREKMRQGAASLTFQVEGLSGYATAAKAALAASANLEFLGKAHPNAFLLSPSITKPKPTITRATEVIGWGDSWLDYRDKYLGIPLGTDLRDCLETTGYAMPKDFCNWTRWTKIESMADNTAPFRKFLANELQLRAPRAILLSGGGNDSTDDVLEALILQKGSPGTKILDPSKLKTHIAKLEAFYVTVLDAIDAEFGAQQKRIPIVVHGYDYPIPTGRGFSTWMFIPFKPKGYDCDTPADRALGARGMAELIDAFNEMLICLQNNGRLVHVELRGTIKTNWPGDPTEGWTNDLHPEDKGFELLAAKIKTAIDNLP